MRDLPKIKLKYLCKSFSSALIARELKTDIQEGYPVFGAAGLMGYKDTYDLESEYLGIVKDGAGVGRINIYPAKSSLLGTMAAIIPNPNVSISWLKYAITSLNLGESVDKATIPHIYFSVYGNSFIWDISKEMQQSIADILDRKCTQIDALIANEEQQIAKLKAYKQSVITETVTKGLDPDVPMKDSGVEWIGEIPESWSIIKYGRVCKVKSNLVHPDSYLNYMQIAPDIIEKGSGKLLPCTTVKEAGIISDNHLFYKGQIIYSKIRPLLNKVTIAPFDGLCSADMYPIDTNQIYKYILYYMLSDLFLIQVKMVTENRVKMPKINQEELSQIITVLPSLSEQQQIADYLDQKCEQIDRLIAIKQQKIEKIQQYKKSVIYEYVTGKREVST